MLDNHFVKKGYAFLAGSYYIDSQNHSSLLELKKLYDYKLKPDGESSFRKRAYIKLIWNANQNLISVSKNQFYYQTPNRNNTDGGKIRKFPFIGNEIINLLIIKSLINKDINLILTFPQFKGKKKLTIGMHFIRYEAHENQASYSSPDWLHIDDEPLVFVHMIALSRNIIGGNNIIADLKTKEIKNVVSLKNDLDTLILSQHCYHAVTPLGSSKGTAKRDIILFTVEPNHTQKF